MSLTDKASQILELATYGKTDKEIAAQMELAPSAIDWHWRRIRKVLNANNRTEAVAKGLKFVYDRERAPIEARVRELQEQLNQLSGINATLREENAYLSNSIDKERSEVANQLRKQYSELDHLRTAGIDSENVMQHLDRMGVLIYGYDARPPYRCHEISPSVHLLGYTQDDFLTGRKTIFDIIYPADVLSLGKEWEEGVTNNAKYFDLQYRYVAADGTLEWARARAIRKSPTSMDTLKFAALIGKSVAALGVQPQPYIKWSLEDYSHSE